MTRTKSVTAVAARQAGIRVPTDPQGTGAMLSRTCEATRERFLNDLADQMNEIAQISADAIRDSIPSYKAAWDLVGPAVCNVILVTKLKLIELWRQGRQATPEELSWLGRIGVPPEEMGISLHDTLHAYRVAAGVIWRYFTKTALRYPDLDTSFLLDAALVGFYYLNDLSLGISHEGVLRARERLRRREDAERSLIEALLERPPRIEEANRIALILGLPLGGSWRVVVARSGGGTEHPTDEISRVADAIRRALEDRCAVHSAVAVIEGRVVAMESGATLNDLEIPDAAVGIGREHPGPGGVAESFGEAREALEIALLKGVPTAEFDEIWLDRLLMGSLTATELAKVILHPLESLPKQKREEWTNTLELYLDCGGNVTTTARQLYVHPHTVRYRLGQLRKLFGPSMDFIDHRLALQIALRARRLQAPGPVTQQPGR